jgi:hypothetical protein
MVELASIADTRGKRVVEGTRGRGRGELCREIFAILYALLLGFAKMYMSSVKKKYMSPYTASMILMELVEAVCGLIYFNEAQQ